MHHLFALQIFLELNASQGVRAKLRDLLATTGEGHSYDDKRAFWTHVADTLGAASSLYERGVWDYVEDTGRAQEEYDQWGRGTVEDAKEAAKGHFDPEGGHAYRSGGGRRFMFVTALFLLRRGGTSDRFVCELCRFPDEAQWTRATFEKLVRALPTLNFASIRSDAIFVRPGASDIAVTETELAEPHYAYARVLT